MKLKESKYNYIFDDLGKDNVILYNSRTGALATLREIQYNQLRQFLDSGKEIKDKEFTNSLLKCGFLIPNEIDENYMIKRHLMVNRYNTKRFSLTIAPTMSCNFKCIYCFEKGHTGQGVMDDFTIDNLIVFLQARLNGVETLHISWFGGEPLLAMPVIEKLSQKMISLCITKNIEYSASIITNGYLYKPKIAERLKELKVKKVQITLDGPKETHDNRRPLVDGKPTFDTIVENLINTKGIIPVDIRINVDENNLEELNNYVQFFIKHDLLNSVSPYLGLVLPFDGAYDKNNCLTLENFSQFNLQSLISNNVPLQSMYPVPRGNYCAADFCNGWIIDHVGNVYKCWSEIGISERSIGNINNEVYFLEKTDILKEFLDFDPTKDERCKDCKVLPICMGGCPHNRLFGQDRCSDRLYNIQQYIIACAKSIQNNNNKLEN